MAPRSMGAMQGEDRGVPGSVLIVRLGAIGDVVNALVVASALRAQVPGVRIGWAVHELALPLVEHHPAIDRVHVWRKGTGLAGFRGVLREVREARYELAIDLQRIAKSAVLARLSGAPRVLGFDRERAKEASWLLSRETLPPSDGGAHMVEQYMEFVRHLGLDAGEPLFELPRDEAAEQAARTRIRELGAAPIVMHVGATKPANRWAAENFGELARRCVEELDVPVCISGGPGDREAAALAKSRCPSERCVEIAGRTGLLELAELQRRSALCVSCDSGPLHLAAAVGATVVALFGASDPRRTGPYGERHRVVRELPACAPCNLRACNQPRHICMQDLSVERVFDAVRQTLGEVRSPRRNR
jgi:lipopolysaccharide heptosyltransferase II